MAISAQRANVWLAFGTASERQRIWDALAADGLLRIGAPPYPPEDHWSMWIRGINHGGGGGVSQGPAGPPGPGFSEYQFASNEGAAQTDQAPYVVDTTLAANVVGGDYRIAWSAELQAAAAAALDFQVQLDGSPINTVLDYTSVDVRPFAGFTIATLAAGAHTVTIEFGSQSIGTDVFLFRRRLDLWRVG